jgi:hypothetical protein
LSLPRPDNAWIPATAKETIFGRQDSQARPHSNAFRYVTSNCLYRKLWQKSFHEHE